MTEEKTKSGNLISILRQLIALIMEIGILVLVIIILIWPGIVKHFLVGAGIAKANLGPIAFELNKSSDSTKEAGTSISEVKENLADLYLELTKLQQEVRGQKSKTEVSKIMLDLKRSSSSLEQADNSIISSLIHQQQLLKKTSATSLPQEGWIFLGAVDESKQKWNESRPKSIVTESPCINIGTEVELSKTVYLRADNNVKFHTSAPVIGVVVVGECVRVVGIDYIHRTKGGWVLWARIEKRD